MLDDVELLPVLHMHIIVASNTTVCATCTGTCCKPHTALFVALYMPACCKGCCLFAAATITQVSVLHAMTRVQAGKCISLLGIPELLNIVWLPVVILLLGLEARQVLGKPGASCNSPLSQGMTVWALMQQEHKVMRDATLTKHSDVQAGHRLFVCQFSQAAEHAAECL